HGPHIDLELYVLEGGRERLHARERIVAKGNTGLVAAQHDSLYAKRGAEHSQLGHMEKSLGGGRERPKTVADFEADILDRPSVGNSREAPVDVEFRVLARDVI